MIGTIKVSLSSLTFGGRHWKWFSSFNDAYCRRIKQLGAGVASQFCGDQLPLPVNGKLDYGLANFTLRSGWKPR